MAVRRVLCSTTRFHGLRSILYLLKLALLLMSEHGVHVIIGDACIDSWTKLYTKPLPLMRSISRAAPGTGYTVPNCLTAVPVLL